MNNITNSANRLKVILEICSQFYFIRPIGLTIKTGMNIYVISINTELGADDVRKAAVDDDDKKQSRSKNSTLGGDAPASMWKDLEELPFNMTSITY